MKSKFPVIFVVAILGTFLLVIALGEQVTAADTTTASDAAKERKLTKKQPLYRPPFRGAPVRRIGGGTRGIGNEAPVLYVLAPEHAGLTISEQPSLFWYVSRPTDTRIEITVNDEKSYNPVLELNLKAPGAAGVQRLNLSDHGLRLKPGEQYEWFVALVVDPKSRSNDIISSGIIERAPPSKTLAERLKNTEGADHYFVYAEEGFWYDAISNISDQIDATANNQAMVEQRDSLLEQVGLK